MSNQERVCRIDVHLLATNCIACFGNCPGRISGVSLENGHVFIIHYLYMSTVETDRQYMCLE